MSARTFSDILARIISDQRSQVVPTLKLNFQSARELCRINYGLSDYKLLFGIVRKEDLFAQMHAQYWTGHFRGVDDTSDKGKTTVKALTFRTVISSRHDEQHMVSN